MSLEIRGIHCDPARRPISIKTIKKIIKKSSECGINTLHLHLTDDQGIAFESNVLNYHYNNTWSINEQEEIYKYATKYNIDIIPEIDIPGHSVALRSILEKNKYAPNKQMGIISDGLIKLEHMPIILNLYTEIANRFKCKYFHMGGDETKGGDKEYFQKIVNDICDWGKQKNISIIAWEDILNKVDPPENLIIQKWKVYSHKKFHELDKKRTIISFGYYLDKMTDPYTMFRKAVDSEVLGCIACTWGELIGEENIMSSIFPSLYLLAEKWKGANCKKNPVELLYQKCEDYGWIDNNNQNTWKRRQWGVFVLNKNNPIPPRSSSSTTTDTILNREHDNYPLISNFLIKFAYDIYNLIHKQKIPNNQTIENYNNLLEEAGGNKEMINLLWNDKNSSDETIKIIEKIKRTLQKEEQQLYKNGFICVFRELLRDKI
jgi:hypothetical protein